jgi:transcriptional regulator with XRE-family HTH domain
MVTTNPRMITGQQMRAARAMLRWTVAQLAERAGVSETTVRRGERVDGVPRMSAANLNAIQRALEAAGILFLDEGDVRSGGAGLRLRR